MSHVKASPPSMLIPARNTVTKENKLDLSIAPSENFHLQYDEITDFRALKYLDIHKLTEAEIDKLAKHLPEVSAITSPILKEEIAKINTNYPYMLPDWLKMILTIMGTLISIIIVVTILYFRKSTFGRCSLNRFLSRRKQPTKTPGNQHCTPNSIELQPVGPPTTNDANPTSNNLSHRIRDTTVHHHPDAPIPHSVRVLPELPRSKSSPASPRAVKAFLVQSGIDVSRFSKKRRNRHVLTLNKEAN